MRNRGDELTPLAEGGYQCMCMHAGAHTPMCTLRSQGPRWQHWGWEKAQTQKVESPGLGGSRATVGGGATAHLGV